MPGERAQQERRKRKSGMCLYTCTPKALPPTSAANCPPAPTTRAHTGLPPDGNWPLEELYTQREMHPFLLATHLFQGRSCHTLAPGESCFLSWNRLPSQSASSEETLEQEMPRAETQSKCVTGELPRSPPQSAVRVTPLGPWPCTRPRGEHKMKGTQRRAHT